MSADVSLAAEQALRLRLETRQAAADPSPLFILGAPRTGSTLLYQAMASAFGLAYFSNFVNAFFPRAPVLGLAVQKAFSERGDIPYSSRYGKTEGLFQPSEASAVMRDWFGGEHPSQSRSCEFLPGQARQAVAACQAAQSLFGRPLVIKNAWNCFRVGAIARALPKAGFVWIRRDLCAAAKSDLHARYAVEGSATAWNSATPHNVEALRKRPHWEQVVENQREFSVALQNDLGAHAQGRFIEVWYEDFCLDPAAALRRIAQAWPGLGEPADADARASEVRRSLEQWNLPGTDAASIEAYARANPERFPGMRYAHRGGDGRAAPAPRPAAPHWDFRRVTRESLDGYLRSDWVREWLAGHSLPGDEALIAQRWLLESPPKRHVFAALYGDLLATAGLRILDVGGGLSAFTRELARRHRYELVELLAHDAGIDAADAATRFEGAELHRCDWLEFQPKHRYDLIVANDLFPNVDQRLELFLAQLGPCCRELRLSLTVYDEPRHYRARRTDGDEILFMLAWNWEQLKAAVGRAGGPPAAARLAAAGTPPPPVFPNRRQVVLATVRGLDSAASTAGG